MPKSEGEFTLREIGPGEKFAGLSLGDAKYLPLKTFAQRHAALFHQQHLAKTYVVDFTDNSRTKTIAYITLVCGEIVVENGTSLLPADIPFAYKSFPAVKIARLAVDKEFRGLGIGDDLVSFALGTTKSNVCPAVGCRFMVVDSKIDSVNFYSKRGFTMIDTPENRQRSEPVMFIDLWRASDA